MEVTTSAEKVSPRHRMATRRLGAVNTDCGRCHYREGKFGFRTAREAWCYIRWMVERGTRRPEDDRRLHAYFCTTCKLWHVGHKPVLRPRKGD